MRRQHGVLQRVGGVIDAAARDHGQPVELTLVAVEQLLERIAVTGDVRGEQFSVRAIDTPAGPHSRTLNGPGDAS
jgi:hypothetical protein